MKYEIGTLRSVLSHPGLTSWHVALKMLRGWPDAQQAEQVALPYVQSIVTRWSSEVVRWAPRELVNEMGKTPRAGVRGAALIQGIVIPSDGAYIQRLKDIASNGWFAPPLQRLELSDVRGRVSPLDVLEDPHVDLSGLTHLMLRGCAMSDRHLNMLHGLVTLRHLDVSSNVLTGKSVGVLCEPEFLPGLKFLDVRGNLLDESDRDSIIGSARVEAGCEIEA